MGLLVRENSIITKPDHVTLPGLEPGQVAGPLDQVLTPVRMFFTLNSPMASPSAALDHRRPPVYAYLPHWPQCKSHSSCHTWPPFVL